MPKISVVIPAYNCSQYISKTVESVLSQTCKDFEIVIADDGSTDDTKDKVDMLIKEGAPIKYIYHENKGPAVARNTGIRNASGEYIAFLDADDLWVPEKLELQMEIFQKNSDVGLVYSDVQNFDDSRRWQADRFHYSPEQVARQSGWIFPAFFRREVHIPTSTVMVKKKCFDEVGLFDENMKKLCSQDREVFLRITRKYQAHYIHRPLALYRIRAGSRSRQISKLLEGQRYVINKMAKNKWVSRLDAVRALANSYYEAALGYFSIRNIIEGMKNLAISFFYNPINLMKPRRLKSIAGKLIRTQLNDKLFRK